MPKLFFTKFLDSPVFTALVKRAFRKCDADDSGSISTDELYTAILHFYL